MGLFDRFTGPDEEEHNPFHGPAPEGVPSDPPAPQPRPPHQADAASPGRAAVRPAPVRPRAADEPVEREADTRDDRADAAPAAAPGEPGQQPSPSPPRPSNMQPGWLVQDGLLWHSVVAQMRGDGHLTTRDGGELWDVGGQGIVMASHSAQAVRLLVNEVIERGWSPVVIEATSRAVAAQVRAALTLKGVKVAGTDITQQPGVWDEAPMAQQGPAPQLAPNAVQQPSNSAQSGLAATQTPRAAAPVDAYYHDIGLVGDGADALVILEGEQECWDCACDTPIFVAEIHDVLLNPDDAEPGPTISGPLQYIRSMSPEMLDAVRALGANWKVKESGAAGESYVANACVECDALQGDHFIYRGRNAFGPESMRPIIAHEIAGIPFRLDAGSVMTYPPGETLLDMARQMQPAPRPNNDNDDAARPSGPGM